MRQKWHTDNNCTNGTFSILGLAVGVGGLDGVWGIGLGMEMEVRVWGLGKFNISVLFLPHFLFVPLLPVPLSPVPLLAVLLLAVPLLPVLLLPVPLLPKISV